MTFTHEQHEIIARAMDGGDIPGVSVALVRAGETVAAGGFGVRDREASLPMTAETVSSIASLTKSFTGVAVMMLVEQGKLALDKPVQTWLPEFQVADPDASRTITPRMLLCHKSGMGRTGHQDPVFAGEVNVYRDRADLVSRLRDVQLQTPPNDAWSYCNEGYVTLGLLIETVSGVGLEEFFETCIFQPLGLEHTHAGFMPWKSAENGTTGYRRADGTLVVATLPDDYSVYLSTGGIVSTAPDLARYQIATMDYAGNPLLSAGALEQMHSISMPYGDTGWGYGLGWFIRWHAGTKVVAHSGGQAGVATYSLMIPARRDGVVVISNLSGARVAELAEELAGTLLGAPLYRTSVSEPLPVKTRYPQPSPSDLDPLQGTYVHGDSLLTLTLENGRLVARSVTPDDPEPRPAALVRIGDELYMSTCDGSLIRFLVEQNRPYERLLAGGHIHRRTE